jgi:hypothetical protein
MDKASLLIVFLVFLVAIGCAPVSVTGDISVEVTRDQSANFDSYKTFAWQMNILSLNDPEDRWQQRDVQVETQTAEAIEAELLSRGITEVTEHPDLKLFFAIGIDMAPDGSNGEAKQITTLRQNIPRGALGVFLVDYKSGQPVWSAIASVNFLEKLRQEAFTERLNYAMKEMFKSFPR